MDWMLRVTERKVSRMDRGKSTMAQYKIKIEEKKNAWMDGSPPCRHEEHRRAQAQVCAGETTSSRSDR